MSTERDKLLTRLKSFYARNDPDRKYKTFDPILNYAMAEGVEKLNDLLFKKYGEKLVLNKPELGLTSIELNRDEVRHQIELFYLKHDPAKLDKPGDIESLTEFVMVHGIESFNQKLLQKYEEKLSDASREDAVNMISMFYKRMKLVKLKQDCEVLADWGIANSFCSLNLRLIRKYGTGLGELDSNKQQQGLRKKLNLFYERYDKSQLEDEENMQKMLAWTLKHGVQRLNEKLQLKYGAHLDSFVPVQVEKKKTEKKEPKKKSVEEQVEEDEENTEQLRSLCNLFLAKHDQDSLYDGGVDSLMEQIKTEGEQAVEDVLCTKYGEGLKSIKSQFEGLQTKLVMFYKIHDPERLNKPIDNLIGWAIVHGEDKLNAQLFKKYDEDLECGGLKKRLKMFYKQVGEERSEGQIATVAQYAVEKGLLKLNKRLKKKYGKNLEDMFIRDEQIVEEGSYMSERLTNTSANTFNSSPTAAGHKNKERTAKQAVEQQLRVGGKVTGSMVEVKKEREEEEMTNLDEDPEEEEREKVGLKKKATERKEEEEEEVVTDLGDGEVEKKQEIEKESKKTLGEEEIKTERTLKEEKVEEEQPTRFTEAELDLRKGNRNSLKMIRQQKQKKKSDKPKVEGPMVTKLARFLQHVDDYRAVDRDTALSPVPSKPKKSSFVEVDVKKSNQPKEKENFEFTMPRQDIVPPPVAASPTVLVREKNAANNLVKSLMKFYRFHDKKKANGNVVRRDVEFVLKHGRAALNAKLLKKYGESLNSVNLKNQTLIDKKKLKPIQSNRNFMKVTRASMNQLDHILED